MIDLIGHWTPKFMGLEPSGRVPASYHRSPADVTRVTTLLPRSRSDDVANLIADTWHARPLLVAQQEHSPRLDISEVGLADLGATSLMEVDFFDHV